MGSLRPPEFRLSLLGSFQLTRPDGPIDLASKKLAGLLAYLALTAPAPQSREKLATLFWGSHFETQARQNLRKALFRLRRILGQDVLVGDGEEVSLIPGTIDCDAVRLEALIREGSRAALTVAADLYKGRLLADVRVTEEAWADWLAGEQQRLEGLALDAMVRLGELELEAGMHDLALAAGNRAIWISNLREDAHRVVIRALAAAGRRADALKHYEDLVKQLKREFDADPDARTSALADELRKSDATRRRSDGDGSSVSEPNTRVGLPRPDRPSMAVLPFRNLSDDPDQEYFADGMVEEIITALSRFRWLFVGTYKGQSVDVKQVGRELGVLYFLQGSVRKAGTRVRITAQLVDASNGANLWADRFDGVLENVFELQDDVASSVAGMIEPTLYAAETRRVALRPTSDPSAYDLFLRARYEFVWTKEKVFDALNLLTQALHRDPHFAPALALAAVCHWSIWTNGWESNLDLNRHEGLKLAKRALAVSGDDPYVLAHTAHVLGHLGEDISAALSLIDRALELNPNFARGWIRSGWLRICAGDPELALKHFEMFARLSPRESKAGALLGIGASHFYAQRLEEARSMLVSSLQEIPTWAPTYRYLASCYAHMGRLADAREVVKRLRELAPIEAPHREVHLRNPKLREYFLRGLREAAAAAS